MQGTASSLLALASVASMAFLSPTNMASPIPSSRGAAADKRALQLQVFSSQNNVYDQEA